MDSKVRLRDIYDNVKYLSMKYYSYFPVYKELLARYIDKNIILVVVGVFNGDSLFMWREYLGPKTI